MPRFVLLPKMNCSVFLEFTASLIFKLNIFCPRTQANYMNIYFRLRSLTSCCHQQSPVQSWLGKEWEECVRGWESTADSSIHPFNGSHRSWRQQEWSRRKSSIITGAAGAVCPVLRAGKWRCESATAGRRCPQLLLAYEVPPDHLRPPSVSWRWARQPGNHLLLRWWLPASVALPERTKSQFRYLP